MNNHKPLIAFLITLMCVVCIPKYSIAQAKAKVHIPSVTFGDVNGRYTTRDSILANPRLICHEPDCAVTGFTFEILPTDRDIIGPYWISGNQLSDKIKSTLKELPNLRTRVYIDSIQAICKAKKIQLPPVAFQFNH